MIGLLVITFTLFFNINISRATLFTGSYSVIKAIIAGTRFGDSQAYAIKRLSTGHFIIGARSEFPYIDDQKSNGRRDFLIQKYDSSMNWVWTRFAGGTDQDYLFDLAVDSSDNIYAVGSCIGRVDSQINKGNLDWCIFKYDSNGNKLWTKLYGSTFNDEAYGVAVDSTGTYLYVIGYAFNTFQSLPATGGSPSTFWMKLDTATGTAQTTVRINNGGTNYVYGIALDSNDNSYVVGTNWDTSKGYYGIPSNGFYDSTISKFNSTGNGIWHRTVGNGGYGQFTKVVVDASDNVYAVGHTRKNGVRKFGTASLNGDLDATVQGYTSSGDLIFSQAFGGTGEDMCKAVAVDSVNKRLYMVGSTKSVFYGQTARTDRLGSTFIALLSTTNGSIQYTNLLQSTDTDTANAILLSSDVPYLAGATSGDYAGIPKIGNIDLSFLALGVPTLKPTRSPSITPTTAPTKIPTYAPSAKPTSTPTFAPTFTPTKIATTNSAFLSGVPLVLFSVGMIIFFITIIAVVILVCFLESWLYGSQKPYQIASAAYAKADAEAPIEGDLTTEKITEHMELELIYRDNEVQTV